MLASFGNWLIARAQRRAPDFQIGGAVDPYLNRWWLIPRNPLFNIYLHQFIRDDDDRAMHDHPWPSLSLMLRGSLIEFVHTGRRGREVLAKRRVIEAGEWTWRGPTFSHRLVVPYGAAGRTWTLFITGPRIRSWGFHCPQGWRHWRDFTGGAHGEIVGRGCAE